MTLEINALIVTHSSELHVHELPVIYLVNACFVGVRFSTEKKWRERYKKKSVLFIYGKIHTGCNCCKDYHFHMSAMSIQISIRISGTNWNISKNCHMNFSIIIFLIVSTNAQNQKKKTTNKFHLISLNQPPYFQNAIVNVYISFL